MRILSHASALIGIKENVINVERSGNKRLGVSVGNLHVGTRARGGGTINGGDSEKAFIKRTDLNVNLDLVVLEGNKREGKAGVTAVPELKRNVKCGLRKSIARGTDCLRDVVSTASSGNIGETWIS